MKKDMIMVGKRDKRGRLTKESFTISELTLRRMKAAIFALIVGEFLLYLGLARIMFLLGY